jgi:hypothetical protein
MKIDSLQVHRAFELVHEIVKRENWRCRKCDRLLSPRSEFFLPFRFDPSVSTAEELSLWCEHCVLRYCVPRRCQTEIRNALRQSNGQLKPSPVPPANPLRPRGDVCPECGSLMEPNGRCFVCRACGYFRCG